MEKIIHRVSILVFLIQLLSCNCTRSQPVLSIANSSGLKLTVVQMEFPLLKLLCPGQPDTARGIEIEFPEHVTGINEQTNQVEHLYLVTRGDANKITKPVWRVQDNALIYETELQGQVRMTATAKLESDGLRYTYEFTNHANLTFRNLQAVTCVKLYSFFSDERLERTYTHHANGYELLASETPERLKIPLLKWFPCRYLVSYTWLVNPVRIEKDTDQITRYFKSRKADKPFIATISQNTEWIAATYTKETGNLWTNPERSCHHVDPSVTLGAGQIKKLDLKTFLIRGSLNQLLTMIDSELSVR